MKQIKRLKVRIKEKERVVTTLNEQYEYLQSELAKAKAQRERQCAAMQSRIKNTRNQLRGQ